MPALHRQRIFKPTRPYHPVGSGDLVVLSILTAFLYAGVRLAVHAPASIVGPEISRSPSALPWCAFLSLLRMAAAYALSFLFALIYGYKAARSRRAERVLLPILDVLQSVPILSFLPVAVLGLAAFLPERFALELAAIILIFSSQAWNMTFSWYQSLITIPTELQEASTTFRFHPWLRFRTLELPFAAIHLTWNSMMSWAGGWFFLMAAEMFTVGARDFRLVGLGSYLQEAAHRGDLGALGWGLGILVAAIVLLDQLVWRPALAWADRFKVEMVEGEAAPRSWFYEILKGSRLRATVTKRALAALDKRCGGWSEHRFREERAERPKRFPVALSVRVVLGGVVLLAGAGWAGKFLAAVPGQGWGTIALGAGATLARVACALAVAVVWTVPLGVVIGLNRRAATWLQPLVQIAASIPATALFPVLVLGLVHLPGGLNLAAVLLMLAGTQWYLLFNVIAGVSAIPQDLKHTAALLGLSRWQRWRVLLLPSLFPYLVTGAITASGGAWNATIVAEYVTFGGQTITTQGLGALISQATANGNYPVLFAATLTMVALVVAINRFLWRRLYRVAEERYKLE